MPRFNTEKLFKRLEKEAKKKSNWSKNRRQSQGGKNSNMGSKQRKSYDKP